MFRDCLDKLPDSYNKIEIGPILSCKTAWSTNVENICRKSNIDIIKRIEKSTIYLVDDKLVNL